MIFFVTEAALKADLKLFGIWRSRWEITASLVVVVVPFKVLFHTFVFRIFFVAIVERNVEGCRV